MLTLPKPKTMKKLLCLLTMLLFKDITAVIYEIDNSSNIIDKLYIDINYNKKGYYTLNNIPADKIKQI